MVKKNIVFIIHRMQDGGAGGAERVISTLANNAAISGDDVTLITAKEFNTSYYIHPDVRCVSLDDKKNSLFKLFAFIKILKETKCDVIVSFLTGINIFSIIAGRICDVKVIACERTDPKHSATNLMKKILRKLLYRLANGFVFQTEEAKLFFSKDIQRRSIIIPNPLKEPLPEPYTGVRNDEIVTVGRFDSQKNHKLLFEAFSEVAKVNPEVSLTLYGDGPLRAEYTKILKELGISSRVNFPGWHPDVHERILKSRMFVLSSDYEGISNAMLEAMALGIPTISTDCPCGGSRMFIEDGVNGLLVPVGNKKALVNAINKLIIDKDDLSKTISQNCIKIKDKLKVEGIFSMWNSYISKILESNSKTNK
ncbi:glycosyl transferase, group 1 [Dehalobacter sp. UNSWDHB]|uniref:glycosyltransferase n=1 Tax=Dehalobacter sp. UNSWDHB TaxID=1339256 RepID=UPI0003877CF7|nr:glycosyltransferase [Dehalobacter sp. UNSWDHB]EQB22657.1 glycosyl transferase, group 1 [Dehalobacter sp. UNSWDHB]